MGGICRILLVSQQCAEQPAEPKRNGRESEAHTFSLLLLGGSKSPAFLKVALDALEKVLPHVTRVEFPGLGHAASWNTDRGGQPEPVAQELRRFFAEPEHC